MKRGKSMRERMLDELAKVAFAPLEETGKPDKKGMCGGEGEANRDSMSVQEGKPGKICAKKNVGVKAADKLRALELLAKRLEGGVEETQENPLAGLTTEELRLLARAEAERVRGADDDGG